MKGLYEIWGKVISGDGSGERTLRTERQPAAGLAVKAGFGSRDAYYQGFVREAAEKKEAGFDRSIK
ncbi:MAG: hypothetical protein LBI40_01470 [Treponema sp.]|jgi:hypothetical protein|nr:hypothetical protein [Treponema sp.]